MAELLRLLESLPAGPVYGLITALAAVENIFPPVPADTAVALGAFLAGRGTVNIWAVFGLTWGANVASAAAVYFLARRYGRAFFQGRLGRRLVTERTLGRIRREYDRHGVVGIFLSRLLPVWRGVVPPFAAISGVSPSRTLVPLALASAVWYGALTFFVATLGTNLEAVLAGIQRLNVILGIAAGAALVVVGFFWWRHRHHP